MKNVKPQSKPKRRRIQFALTTRAARKVCLAGEFNDWNEQSLPMKRDADGTWKRTALLAPGQYEYKFLVDGDWKEDPANSKRRRNRFGTYNCIVEVALPGVG